MNALKTLKHATLAALLPTVLLAAAPVDSAFSGTEATSLTALLGGKERPAIDQYNLTGKGLALGGYDPVAYFPEGGGKAKEGHKSLHATHRGVTYRFSSRKNKKLFLEDPDRFEPLYGGWCAYGMTQGGKFEVDPANFLIEDGHLMLFYKGQVDTREKWEEEGSETLQPKSDAMWKKLLSHKESR